MSKLYMRALAYNRQLKAHAEVIEKSRAAGVDVGSDDFDPYKPRNRAEKRARVRSLPRGQRTWVHGFGQWRHKFVKDGEYARH